MKDIFTDFYSKVMGFFRSEKNENTKETATNRLKLVLLHDRTNLDTITMQKMREQLIGVISKYIEIDQEALDLNLEGEGDSIALMLNIPVIKARTKEEIEEIEKAELEAKEAEIRAAIEAETVKSSELDEESQANEDEEIEDDASEDESEETESQDVTEEAQEQPDTDTKEMEPESESSSDDSQNNEETQPEPTKKQKNKAKK